MKAARSTSNTGVITNLLAGIDTKEMADLAALTIGSPSSELDVYMRHKKGTEFWIRVQ